MREHFGELLVKFGNEYPNMVVLDADVSLSTRSFKFREKFPNRFFNMGIAEQNMVGAAIGFAISGKIPIVSGFSIFTTGRAWEFIRMVCHDNLNVKIITTHGGIVGEDGSSHNALEDLAIMSTLPNIKVLVPLDTIELEHMMEDTLLNNGPYYIRLPRVNFPVVHKNNFSYSEGIPEVLIDGKDICLIGTGYGCHLALNAASVMKEESNISLKVLNLSTIKPINHEILIKELLEVKVIITIEEHNIYSGVANIISRIVSNYSPKKILNIGIEDVFVMSGKREQVLESLDLSVEKIIEKVKELSLL